MLTAFFNERMSEGVLASVVSNWTSLYTFGCATPLSTTSNPCSRSRRIRSRTSLCVLCASLSHVKGLCILPNRAETDRHKPTFWPYVSSDVLADPGRAFHQDFAGVAPLHEQLIPLDLQCVR